MQENVPLSSHSTMRLGGSARYFLEITNRNQIKEALAWAEEKNLPVVMIGSGSNIVWGDKGFSGLVLVNKINGFDIQSRGDSTAFFSIGAGEDWDKTVERIVAQGFSGVEELSLIPGTAGATPIQNVGAYGREIAETLSTIEAYDSQTKEFVILRASDCQLGYRTSRFKTTDKGRFFITAITLQVQKTAPKQPFYSSLEAYLIQNNITKYTPQIIRDAVIAIRSAKLPDPARVANNGSFFQNPIIPSQQLQDLKTYFPEIMFWKNNDETMKVSAAWLIDQAGFKDAHDQATGMATWPKQSLVLVNEQAHSTADLLAFKQKIVDAVKQKFGIELKQEPEFIEI